MPRPRRTPGKFTLAVSVAFIPMLLTDTEAARAEAPQGTPTQASSARPAAQQANTAPRRQTAGDQGEAVIVTGTRETNKKARDSNSPIDIITSASLRQTGATNITTALTLVNPSITLQAFGSDAGALTDAIRMRGLSPDQVLVLVNGKRRHTTASIYADSGPQEGTTPVDLDMIPLSMVDHIEVLRDGAAAQYGSDAIAGVVNVILKSSPTAGEVQAQTGASYHGDGWNSEVLADKGAANSSGWRLYPSRCRLRSS